MLDLATTPATWVQINAGGVLPQPRSFHSCTTVGTRIVLFGGINRENAHLNDVHVFDAESRVWLQPTVQGNIPPRGFHSAVLHEKNLFVWKVISDSKCRRFLEDQLIGIQFFTITELGETTSSLWT